MSISRAAASSTSPAAPGCSARSLHGPAAAPAHRRAPPAGATTAPSRRHRRLPRRRNRPSSRRRPPPRRRHRDRAAALGLARFGQRRRDPHGARRPGVHLAPPLPPRGPARNAARPHPRMAVRRTGRASNAEDYDIETLNDITSSTKPSARLWRHRRDDARRDARWGESGPAQSDRRVARQAAARRHHHADRCARQGRRRHRRRARAHRESRSPTRPRPGAYASSPDRLASENAR